MSLFIFPITWDNIPGCSWNVFIVKLDISEGLIDLSDFSSHSKRVLLKLTFSPVYWLITYSAFTLFNGTTFPAIITETFGIWYNLLVVGS